jgi:hypothetical protein
MATVRIPDIAITAPHYGTLTSANYKPLHIQLKTGVFDEGGATLEGLEPFPVMDVRNLAGEWLITVDDTTYHYDLDDRIVERLKLGYNGTLPLSDRLSNWKLPLIQKSSTDFGLTPSSTVGDLLQALVTAVSALSGVSCDILVTNTTPLSDVCDGGIYLAANSTYLAEIQQILQWLGYAIYAVPETGRFAIVAPCYTAPIGTIALSEVEPLLMGASYGIHYKQIHSDVLVANSNTGTGKIAGMSGVAPDLTNYTLSKKVNPFLAEVWQLKDIGLQAMADELYKLDRQAAQGLTIKRLGFLPDTLWRSFGWTDINGQPGTYKVVSSVIDIMGTEVTTTLEAMIV